MPELQVTGWYDPEELHERVVRLEKQGMILPKIFPVKLLEPPILENPMSGLNDWRRK